MKILLICDIDSQLFACQYLGGELARSGCDVTFGIDYKGHLPVALIERHLSRFPSTILIDIEKIAQNSKAMAADAVGVFLAGSRLHMVQREISRASQPQDRPVLFCGFNGLIFEKFEEGLAWRLGYDVICLNGPRDLRMWEVAIPARQRKSIVALTGLNRGVRDLADGALVPLEERPKRVVFAEQVVVPRALPDRRYLIAQLARLAEASPDWEVIVKPRIRAGDKTFHTAIEHVTTTMKAVGAKAPNFHVSYEPLSELLETTRICITVSSTAFFEAHALGALPVALRDFGIRNGDGTHVFLGCGTMTALHDIASFDEFPQMAVNSEWLSDLGFSKEFGGDSLLAALQSARVNNEAGDFDRSDLAIQPIPSSVRAQWLVDWQAAHAPPPKPPKTLVATNGAGKPVAPRPAEKAKLKTDTRVKKAALPLPRTALIFSDAKAAYISGKLVEAQQLLRQICLLHPADAKPRRLLAECYVRMGMWEEARQSLKVASRLLPSNKNLARRLRAISGAPWKRRIKMLFSKPFAM